MPSSLTVQLKALSCMMCYYWHPRPPQRNIIVLALGAVVCHVEICKRKSYWHSIT